MARVPVTVYTTPNCVQCESTKRQLTKLGIDFEVVDLSQNPEKLEYFKKLGYASAPIVTTDVKIWSGFRFNKIRSLADYLFGDKKIG